MLQGSAGLSSAPDLARRQQMETISFQAGVPAAVQGCHSCPSSFILNHWSSNCFMQSDRALTERFRIPLLPLNGSKPVGRAPPGGRK